MNLIYLKIIIHHLDGLSGPNTFCLDPVGLLAQLEERCTGVAEVLGSNPVGA